MKIFAIILSLITVIGFSSCRKEINQGPEPAAQNMNQLKVSSNFDWKTTKDVQLTVTGFVNGLIEVNSSENVVYQQAFLQQGKPLLMKLTVPSYEDAIYLLYMGQKVELKLTADNLKYVFKIQ